MALVKEYILIIGKILVCQFIKTTTIQKNILYINPELVDSFFFSRKVFINKIYFMNI